LKKIQKKFSVSIHYLPNNCTHSTQILFIDKVSISVCTYTYNFLPITGPQKEDEFEKTVDLNEEFGKSINGSVGQHPFASMQEHPDDQKQRNPRTLNDVKHIEQQKRYTTSQLHQ
jgi:hypothetical protein